MRRSWPLALVVAALLAAWALGAGDVLSLAGLARQRAALGGWVAAHPVLSPLAFALAYAAVAALALPGAVVMTLAGGLLLGPWLGAACTVAGASLGAALLFLAARRAASGWLAARPGGRLAGMVARVGPGLERDGFAGLLALRLVPVVPFFVVNLAPALAGMRLAPFVAATVLGIAPASAVLSWAGAGLGGVLDRGGTPELGALLGPRVLLPLAGLAALALLPAAWRRGRERGRQG